MRLAPGPALASGPGLAKIWDSRSPYGGFFYPISSGTVPGVAPLGLEVRVVTILSRGRTPREKLATSIKVTLESG